MSQSQKKKVMRQASTHITPDPKLNAIEITQINNTGIKLLKIHIQVFYRYKYKKPKQSEKLVTVKNRTWEHNILGH